MSEARYHSEAHPQPRGGKIGTVHDASGYRIFSGGDAGSAHVMAHRMFDEGRVEDGHLRLGEWLERHDGAGSEWIHLHFHMAVFELALGDWDAAYERFQEHILPPAATTQDALTDAPALLWRLKVCAPRYVVLPWDALRNTALKRLQRPSDPFVEMHNLLALAGAGDTESLEGWIRSNAQQRGTGGFHLAHGLAPALAAMTRKQYRLAARLLADLAPRFADAGGSRAQNRIFHQLLGYCQRQYDANRLAA